MGSKTPRFKTLKEHQKCYSPNTCFHVNSYMPNTFWLFAWHHPIWESSIYFNSHASIDIKFGTLHHRIMYFQSASHTGPCNSVLCEKSSKSYRHSLFLVTRDAYISFSYENLTIYAAFQSSGEKGKHSWVRSHFCYNFTYIRFQTIEGFSYLVSIISVVCPSRYYNYFRCHWYTVLIRSTPNQPL